MKIVNIIGGLGNQMFQYALAVVLQKKFPDETVKIYTGAFNGYSLHNGFELPKIFNLRISQASHWEVFKVYWPIMHYRLWQIAHHLLPSRKGFKEDSDTVINVEVFKLKSFFDGYFQRYALFESAKSEIHETFRFPEFSDKNNFKAQEFLRKGESVSIHVRRGDYLSNSAYSGICTMEYYTEAIKVIKEKTSVDRVLIFSNDITWCKTAFNKKLDGLNIMYVDWNVGPESFRDMQLMSLCDHNIIANSSFSWWGAFLNPNPKKIIICPSKWMNCNGWDDIIPDDWTKIRVQRVVYKDFTPPFT